MPILTVRQGIRRLDIPFSPGDCLGDLLHGLDHAHPCGGRGTCGKCRVMIAGQAHSVLSCQTRLDNQDTQVFLPESLPISQIALTGTQMEKAGADSRVGAAVDIGTTTVALALYDLGSGACLAETGMLNPQTSIAADVIGRIDAAINGQLDTQQKLILAAIDTLLERACAQAHIEKDRVTDRVITGNTTMLYLLTGNNPVSLSHAPFEADTLFGVQNPQGYLPPCMNAFVGADITCAALASGMCQSSETALLCDLGTNGELALWKDGRLYVTSTAAGPVFEGASISCGVASVPGAIDRVWVQDGALCVHTIADAPAIGVCGSGLLDACAAMLELEIMDETGYLEDETCQIAPGVSLTQADIRAVQLAKAAIYAGIRTLLHTACCSPEEIARFHVAGGFGSHARMTSAAAIGMLPENLAARAGTLGNAALRGAAMLLLQSEARREAEAIAASAVHVPLGGNPVFNETYIDAMMFEQEEER